MTPPQYYPSNEDMYMQSQYPPVGPGAGPQYPQTNLYAAYNQPMNQGMMPPQGPAQGQYMPVQTQFMPMPVPAPMQYSAQGNPYMASQYYPMPGGPQPDSCAKSTINSQSAITEESMHAKINAKIDSIMEVHKAEVLGNQIERLTDKVQKLSNKLDYAQVSKESRLQSSFDSADCRPVSLSSSSDTPDAELTRRLKKLAAESSRRAARASGDGW